MWWLLALCFGALALSLARLSKVGWREIVKAGIGHACLRSRALTIFRLHVLGTSLLLALFGFHISWWANVGPPGFWP